MEDLMDKPDHGNALPSAPSDPAAACGSGACCPLGGRWGLWVWVLLLVAIAYLQWPMLKGMFYKLTEAQSPPSSVAWRSSFDAALAESARTGKPILADFSASWCPPCTAMKHDVWPDTAVARAANEGYIPLLVDVDSSEGAELARRYGVNGIPTILILGPKGQVVRAGSYMSRGDMLDFLKPAS